MFSLVPYFADDSTVKNKYRQVIEKPKSLPYEVFGTVKQKKSTKNCYDPPYAFFRYRELSETPKCPPHQIFRYCETKELRQHFVIPHLWFAQLFAPDRWAVPTLSCSSLVC